MNQVQPGDVIFSYVGGRIVAVSIARTAAHDSPRPRDLGEGLWEDAGKRIEVEYRDLATPLSIAAVITDLQPLMAERYSPIDRNGTGNQGYLFALPPRAGRFLLDRIDQMRQEISADAVEDGIVHAVKDLTERRALVLSRIGQGQFRDSLMIMWGRRCAVTGLDIPALLRASHIKPWRDSDNHERLDPYNGFLLSPSYDAAFDSGLVSFGDDVAVILSSALTPARIERLGIDPAARIVGLHDKHRAYLGYHRREAFVSGQGGEVATHAPK
jgi:hypothetical protein